jgi:hypothetical protein
MLLERKQAKISTYADSHKKIIPSYTLTKGRRPLGFGAKMWDNFRHPFF